MHCCLKRRGRHNNIRSSVLRMWFRTIEPEYRRPFLDMSLSNTLEALGLRTVWKRLASMNIVQLIEAEKV